MTRINKPTKRLSHCEIGETVTLKGALSSGRPMYYGAKDERLGHLWRNEKAFRDKKLADCVVQFCHEVL